MEIVVDGLALSDEKVHIKELIDVLKQKLSKGVTMNTHDQLLFSMVIR